MSYTKISKPTPTQLAEGLIISVGEARKILGVEAKIMTDDELASYLLELSDLGLFLLNVTNLPN